MIKGLNSKEVKQRLSTFGYNELPSEKPKDIFGIALQVFKEPMFILLIACGILYLFLGEVYEGIILFCTVFIIIFITFYQYQKTEKALGALKNLSSPRALVIRNGKEERIPGREVVPDDIVILNEGDRVPADGVLLESLNLSIDESILTGESVPVSKTEQHDPNDKRGVVYSGTLVIQGKAFCKISATGMNTEFGKIGRSLMAIEQQETRFQTEMKSLVRNFFILGGSLSLVVIVAFYIVRGNFLQSLLNGLANAMAILPEEFPVVLTVFLALGAWRLSKKKVLTRKPSAIETLGAATVLCTDKTGTITQNKMEVALINDESGTIFKKDFKAQKERLATILNTAYLASYKDSIDPMEKAIAVANQSLNNLGRKSLKLVKEYPLTKSLLAMTRVLKHEEGGDYIIATKGAPETVFKLCGMGEEEIRRNLKIVESLASKGNRILAVAATSFSTQSLPDAQDKFDLKLLGFLGLEDPIRPEVPQAVKECSEAGVRVIMITGDFPSTARSIAQQVGLVANKGILTGPELERLNDDELREKIQDINIFARVIPDQKLRIVRALQANNEVVAMTGDGVNDAPALKAADIGVAMGNKGTDVAREASSLVLLDDNFASIVMAIRLGRRIFDNLQKAMSYIIAIHIPIIGLTLLPAFFSSLPILMMPLQVVFLELIIDPICSIAFENEKEEDNIMKRSPRDPREKFFGAKKIFSSASQGLLLLGMTMVVYFLSIREGHSPAEVRAIAYSSLIIGNIFLILTNLSKTKNFLGVIIEKNWAVLIILSIATIMLLLILTIPFFQDIFKFEFPGFVHFLPPILGASAVLIILETLKYLKKLKLYK